LKQSAVAHHHMLSVLDKRSVRK